MRAGALYKAAVKNQHTVFIGTQHGFKFSLTLVSGFLHIPLIHIRNGKKKLSRAGNMIFLVGSFIGHGVHDKHGTTFVYPLFQLCGGHHVIVAALHFLNQLDRLCFQIKFVFRRHKRHVAG
jgi:hypothetical protein